MIRQLDSAAVIAGVFILFVFVWFATDGFQASTLERRSAVIEGLFVPAEELQNIVFLQTATDGPANGNYDSFDSPLGTPYVTPATGMISANLHVVGDSNHLVTVELGYGDTYVTDSAAAPANAVQIGEWSWAPGGVHNDEEIPFQWPAGKIPWARVIVSGGGAPVGHMMIYGLELP